MCSSDLSWLAEDAMTRDEYRISIPARTGGLSGQCMTLGISITSQLSCLTTSFMPQIAYVGRQRWVRIRLSASTDISDICMAGMAVLGRPHQWPVAVAEVV